MAVSVGAIIKTIHKVCVAGAKVYDLSRDFIKEPEFEKKLDIAIIAVVVVIMILVGLIGFIALSPIGYIASLLPVDTNMQAVADLRQELTRSYEAEYTPTGILALPFPAGYKYTSEKLSDSKIIFKLDAAANDTDNRPENSKY